LCTFILVNVATSSSCNVSGPWLGGSTEVDVEVEKSSHPPFSFFASAEGAWQRQSGTYWPSNGSLYFSCCGGIWGSISMDCNSIAWIDSNHDTWVRAGPSRSASISSPFLSVGLTVSLSGETSVDRFSFFGAGASTVNFALPAAAAKQAGSSLVVPAGAPSGGGALVPTCGTGCNVASTPTTATVSGLTFQINPNSPPLAQENWTLTLLNDTAFEWSVERVGIAASGPQLAVDRLGISLQTTGGLPIHSQQIPSFVDLEMFLNESSTGGFDIGAWCILWCVFMCVPTCIEALFHSPPPPPYPTWHLPFSFFPPKSIQQATLPTSTFHPTLASLCASPRQGLSLLYRAVLV